MRRTNSGFVQHVGKKKKGNKRGERSEQSRTTRRADEHPRRPGTPPHPPRTFFFFFSLSPLAGCLPLFLLVCVSVSLSRTAQWHCAREERRREEAEGREPVLR